ncbi:DNA polymerase III subunit gamma and tau, partial [Kitasatospora sp. NPDC059571]
MHTRPTALGRGAVLAALLAAVLLLLPGAAAAASGQPRPAAPAAASHAAAERADGEEEVPAGVPLRPGHVRAARPARAATATGGRVAPDGAA